MGSSLIRINEASGQDLHSLASFWLPQLVLGEEFAISTRDRFSSERGSLIPDIRFSKEDRLDTPPLDLAVGLVEFVLRGHLTDDYGRGVIYREVSTGFVCCVDCLDKLLREGKVRADQNVEVSVYLCHGCLLLRKTKWSRTFSMGGSSRTTP